MESYEQRLKNIVNHLRLTNGGLEMFSSSSEVELNNSSAPVTTSKIPKWDKQELSEYLEAAPEHVRVAKKGFLELLKDPIFAPCYDMNEQEWRELTLQRTIKVIRSCSISLSEFNIDPMKHLASLEIFNLCDPSLSVKLGVHFSFFGKAVLCLGTEKHHLKYIKDIDTWKLPGCFGMTELGHGSNVQGIETTTYDKNTEEFIINTPSDSAQKFWIGNAAYLVNSFNIPEQFIHAPISKPNYIQEFRYGLNTNY